MVSGRVEWVAAGRSGDVRLLAVVRELQHGDPLTPVWVAVRSPVVSLHLRREFAAAGAFAGVRFSPITRLIELIGAPLAVEEGRLPLVEAALRAACRSELAEAGHAHRSSWLSPVAGHPATEAALARSYRSIFRLDTASLQRLGHSAGRLGDVVALARSVRGRLSPHFLDADELADLAVRALEDASAVLDDVGPVVAFAPDPLPPSSMRFVAALAHRTEVRLLARLTGDELADRAVTVAVDRLVATGFAESPGSRPAPARAGRVEVLSLPDEDEEARVAVRLLVGHAEAGGDLGRCVVTFPHRETSEAIAQRISSYLRRAGLPFSGDTGMTLAHTPEGRVLLGLVRLACDGEDEPRLERRSLMAWLRCGPVRADRGPARGLGRLLVDDGAPVPRAALAVGRMDRCSRAAGVVGGLGQWRSRLASYARRPSERWAPGSPGPLAGDLLVFVERLAAMLGEVRGALSWGDLAGWAARALEKVLVPSEQRDALADALGELRLLEAVEPLSEAEPAARCERLLAGIGLVLERPAPGGDGRFGTGPVIGSLHAIAGVGSQLTIVLGCSEGALPARPVDDPLLPRLELERLGGELGEERPDARDRRDLLGVLAASDVTVMTWPRVELALGREVIASRWLQSAPVSARPDSLPSFARGLARVAAGQLPAADEADFVLAGAAAAPRRSGQPPEHFVFGFADLERRLSAERARGRPGLSRFAGDLRRAGGHRLDTGDLFAGVLSPTTLESFAACPFRHFLDHVLLLGPLDAPEQIMTIEARDRGTLIHHVLEAFFRPSSEDAPAAPLELDAAQLERLRELAELELHEAESQGKTGKELFWKIERQKIRRDLERFVALEVERARARSARPVAVEVSFGRGEEAPVVIRAGGRDVAFGGQMDRVDVEADGSVVVIDYKSGSSDGYKDIETDALGRGRHLQLPIYAKAATQRFASARSDVQVADGHPSSRLRAEYRFVSSEAGFGVVRVELTDMLDAALVEVLDILVSTIDSGCFPPNPGKLERFGYANCSWCDFDGVCPSERAELWAHAKTDGAMSGYVGLVGEESLRP